MMKLFKHHWIKAIIAILFFVLVYFALRILHVDYSRITPAALKEKILAFGIWAPVIYIIFYSLRPIILFPAGILSIVGGLSFGPLWGTAYTVVGATICALLEFLIARYFGRGAVAKFIKGKLISLDQGIERHGFMTVLWVRLIPNVAYDIQNYSLGLTKVRLKDYFLATFFGIIPGTFGFVYLGYSLSDFRQLWKIMVAALIIIAIYFTQGYLRKKRSL